MMATDFGLSEEQQERYERDGFLLIENFVSDASCEALRARAARLVEAFDPAGAFHIFSTREQTRKSDDYFLESGDRIRFFFEEDAFLPNGRLRRNKEHSINKIGHALHDLDPVFNQFSRAPQLERLVSDLGIAQPLLIQSMYIFKQPRVGGEVTCHQDSTFLYTEPPSAVGLWFALEDATETNGCLRAIPGGHKLGLKSRFVRAPEGGTRFSVFDSSPWPEDRLVPLEAPRGTLIILNGLLPHSSYRNNSPRSRHAYTLHVIDGACRYAEDNWLRRAPSLPLRGFR